MGLETSRSPGTLAVLVLATDALIEALPARPVQLAHACSALGYDLVVPLSWGDELIADATLHALNARSAAPAVLCACPMVRERLLHDGGELAPSIVSLVSPPAAVARYLRTRLGDRLGSLSFAGRCPSARLPEYDHSYQPSELLALLRRGGIEVEVQPDVFTDRVPPDRRRHLSLPGGCPAPEVLWHACNERVLVELEGPDLAMDLAQLLLSPKSVLVDVAVATGCSCSGVTHSTVGRSARIAATSIEPPRSGTPVLGEAADLELEVELPIHVSEDKHLTASTYVDAPAFGTPRSPMAVTPPNALPITR